MARTHLTSGLRMAWQRCPLHNPRCRQGWFKRSRRQSLHPFHHPHLTWTDITRSVRSHHRQSSPAVLWVQWVLPQLPARTSLPRRLAQCHRHSRSNHHSNSLSSNHYLHNHRQQRLPVPPCLDLLASLHPRNLLRAWGTVCPLQRTHWVGLPHPLQPLQRSQHLQPPRPVTSLAL